MKKVILLSSILLSFYSLSQYSYTSPYHTFTTPYGNIQLGPANSQYAHILTNRPNFYFDKTIYLGTGELSAFSTNNLKLMTNGSPRITILSSNGNVGIATGTPREKLEIQGHTLIPSGYKIKFGVRSTTSGYLDISNSSCCFNTYADYYGNVYFRRLDVDGNPLGATLAVQSDGSVAIGIWEKYDNTVANTDGHKLMVNGGILCEKIKVIADVPNSDHVFAPTYKLINLEV